jgi:hypothetical protein
MGLLPRLRAGGVDLLDPPGLFGLWFPGLALPLRLGLLLGLGHSCSTLCLSFGFQNPLEILLLLFKYLLTMFVMIPALILYPFFPMLFIVVLASHLLFFCWHSSTSVVLV